MKKFAKRAAAVLLAVVMTFSLAGCYSEDMAWSARLGDTELPIGAYIYYLSVGYNEAAAYIDSETEVLDGEVEGTDAETWIRDRAQTYVNRYFWIDQEMERLGLEMTEADYEEALANTTSYWSLFGSMFEEYGVAQTSFDIAYSQYNVKYLKIFEALYGEGGEREISEADILQQYIDTYYNYEYFLVPLTTTAEDGTSVDMTEEEIAELTEKLEATKKEVEDGDITVTEAASEYAMERAEESTYQIGLSSKANMEANYMPESFIENITTAEVDDVVVFEATGYMVLAKLLPIEDSAEIIVDDEESRLTLMIELKSAEFGEYVTSAAVGLEGVEMNEKAISRYKPSMFAEFSPNGTSTAEETTEESAAE